MYADFDDEDFDSADAVEFEAARIWDEPIVPLPRDRGNRHHGCSHKRTNGSKPRNKR